MSRRSPSWKLARHCSPFSYRRSPGPCIGARLCYDESQPTLPRVGFPVACGAVPPEIEPPVPSLLIALFKPYDVLCQFTDAEGRATLKALVPVPGIYPVGRLDRDSEGLLLLTDDGPLAHRLTDPRYGHPRTYLVQVEGIPDDGALEQLRRGLILNDGPTLPAEAERLAEAPDLPERSVPIRVRKSVPTCWLRLTLREGRNRQVRRMTAAVGHPTLRLVRVAIGPIALGTLVPGERRELSEAERQDLHAIRDPISGPGRRPQTRRRRHYPKRRRS